MTYRHPPSAGSRCKGTIKFADVQENSDFFFAIFSLEDARGASYSLEMRGKEYSNIIRENKHKKETVLGNESTFLEH